MKELKDIIIDNIKSELAKNNKDTALLDVLNRLLATVSADIFATK
jgi:hypothetical protein